MNTAISTRKRTLLALVWVPLLWGGCKISERTYTATDHTPPATYNQKGDTTQGNNRNYADFFTDKNLVALIDSALKNNADYNIALQKVQAAKANYLQRKGDLLPTLELRGSSGQTRFGKYTMDGMGNMTTPGVPYPEIADFFVGAGASWEVDLWGKMRNKKKAAKLRFLATDAGKNLVATNLIAEVAYRYYTLAGLDEELNIIKKNVQLQESALEIIKLQKEGGRATELAVKQFAALLAKTQGMEYKIKTEIVAMENELNFLLGRYPASIARNPISTADADRVTNIGVPARLLNNRADIIQAELELYATKADVAAAKAAFLPSVNLGGTVGYNAYNTHIFFNPASFAYNLIGNLASPILNKNALRANYNTLLAEHKGAFYQYGKTVMNAVFEVITGIESLENLRSEYRYNKNAASELNDAVTISNDLYIAGYANYMEIITAQKNALEAELDVVQTKQKLLFSSVSLYRALGGK